MSRLSNIYLNNINQGPPASWAKSNLQLPLHQKRITKGLTSAVPSPPPVSSTVCPLTPTLHTQCTSLLMIPPYNLQMVFNIYNNIYYNNNQLHPPPLHLKTLITLHKIQSVELLHQPYQVSLTETTLKDKLSSTHAKPTYSCVWSPSLMIKLILSGTILYEVRKSSQMGCSYF